MKKEVSYAHVIIITLHGSRCCRSDYRRAGQAPLLSHCHDLSQYRLLLSRGHDPPPHLFLNLPKPTYHMKPDADSLRA